MYSQRPGGREVRTWLTQGHVFAVQSVDSARHAVSDEPSSTADAIQRQLRAVDIDLKCALAFNRVLLKGLAATSAQARHALDVALNEELRTIAFDNADGAAAVQKMVEVARTELGAESSFRNALAHDLEQAILDCAAALADDEDQTAHGAYPLRSCA